MFVAESYIIAVVNGVIAFGFIMMADAPKDPTNLNSKCKFISMNHAFSFHSFIHYKSFAVKIHEAISRMLVVLENCLDNAVSRPA